MCCFLLLFFSLRALLVRCIIYAGGILQCDMTDSIFFLLVLHLLLIVIEDEHEWWGDEEDEEGQLQQENGERTATEADHSQGVLRTPVVLAVTVWGKIFFMNKYSITEGERMKLDTSKYFADLKELYLLLVASENGIHGSLPLKHKCRKFRLTFSQISETWLSSCVVCSIYLLSFWCSSPTTWTLAQHSQNHKHKDELYAVFLKHVPFDPRTV